MNYQTALTQLNNTIAREQSDYMQPHKDHAWFLERTQRFFDLFGNPEQQFSYVHIAGSSGKGSTAMMAYRALYHAGHSVGVYMSPYVSIPTENIGINGQFVDPQLFADAVAAVLPVVAKIEKESPEWRPSYAEIFFAVAMHCFTAATVETLVIETGCGGRFDKTNIIPTPRATILTPLTYDHTDLLGETIEEIAWHKAGVIKNGSVVVSTVQDPIAQSVFDTEAKKQHVTIEYVTPQRTYTTAMLGAHQQVNAAGVDRALARIGIDETSRLAGIADARIPARVEIMPTAPDEPTVLLDGAHSPGKMEALVWSLQNEPALHSHSPSRRTHLLFAAKETKSIDDVIRPIAPHIDTATMTSFQLQGFGSHDPQLCADALQKMNTTIAINVEFDPTKALQTIFDTAEKNDLIVVTGSLYLVGILRERWYPKEKMLTQQTAFPI